MATVLRMKPLIEVRANYGFIFLLKISRKGVEIHVSNEQSPSK